MVESLLDNSGRGGIVIVFGIVSENFSELKWQYWLYKLYKISNSIWDSSLDKVVYLFIVKLLYLKSQS